jgi:hypothetical protein
MCPLCGNAIVYTVYLNWWRAKKENRKCESCTSLRRKKTQFQNGHLNLLVSKASRKQLSNSQKKRYTNPEERKRAKEIAKIAMHRPDVRKRHLKALAETKFLGKSTDKGQIEMLKKWNQLGFKFEPNYQLVTDTNLFYLDGYDEARNVVLEFDSAYHLKPKQKEKDAIRQEKIIAILSPKKFWRFDSTSKSWKNIMEES